MPRGDDKLSKIGDCTHDFLGKVLARGSDVHLRDALPEASHEQA